MKMLLVHLRWTWLHSQVKGSSSHSNLALTQALAWINSRIYSWKEWGEVLKAWEYVEFEWTQQLWKEGWKDIYRRAPKTSRCCAVKVIVGTSDTIRNSWARTLYKRKEETSKGERGLGWNFQPYLKLLPDDLYRQNKGSSDGGRNFQHRVGTFDPYSDNRDKCSSGCIVSLMGC